MPRTAKALASEIEAVWNAADAEGRDLTPAERSHMEELLVAAKSQHGIEKQIRELDPGSVSFVTRLDGGAAHGGGPGDRFIASKGYQQIRDSSGRGQQWSTGPVEVAQSMQMHKGTLLENVGGAGPGGGLVPPFYAPGIVDRLLEPLGVADVFGQSTVSASQVRYVVEGTATNAAAGVAEGASKPESTLGYTETTEAIRKIATVLPISDEMLEDGASIQSYLNGRLSLFVKVEEERQLLRGAGAASNELLGIMGAGRGINGYTRLAADDNAVAIARVIANTAGSSFVQPDTVIMSPANWLSSRLLRDGTGGTTGQYFGGGPFSGAYGQGGASGVFGQQLWNVRVVLSNYVGAGTALVGNFGQSAHIWRRSGVTVEASNSHSDFYVNNLTMLRVEERLGLGVFRPTAFTEVRGLV